MTWQTDPQGASTASAIPGTARKKRRRQRSLRGKRQRLPQGRGNPVDGVHREAILQELEGLLRQIREEAEESSNGTVSEERIVQMARAVNSFNKVLEEQSDRISQRAREEYQRLRETLVQALRGDR